MRKLGWIGGMGPGATVHYYRELVKAQAGDMLMVHADVDRVLQDVQSGNRVALAGYFARLVERLAAGGAEVAAICAIAPHLCINELQQISVLPLVNIVDDIQAEIQLRGYKRISLFGTRAVMESRMFGMLKDVEVVVPEQVETIHDIYMQMVAGGRKGMDVLSRIAHKMPVDAVLVAGTDFSSVFAESKIDFIHMDCAAIHIQSIVRRLQ